MICVGHVQLVAETLLEKLQTQVLVVNAKLVVYRGLSTIVSFLV